MRKIISLLTLSMILVLNSCIEQDYVIWEGAEVEFQHAVVTAPAPGLTYPRMTVANTVGNVNLQVNLVAAHRPNDEVVTYRVVEEASTAVAGTHYIADGTVLIPANTSFGTLELRILDFGPGTGGPYDLTLELMGNENLAPSENYRRVQVRITQPAPPTTPAS